MGTARKGVVLDILQQSLGMEIFLAETSGAVHLSGWDVSQETEEQIVQKKAETCWTARATRGQPCVQLCSPHQFWLWNCWLCSVSLEFQDWSICAASAAGMSVSGQGCPRAYRAPSCFENLCTAVHSRDLRLDSWAQVEWVLLWMLWSQSKNISTWIQFSSTERCQRWSFEISPSIFLGPSLMPQVKNDIKPDGLAVEAVWVKRESPRKGSKFKC